MRRLASLVHPANGVRFSPYAYVDPKRDVVLSRSELTSTWRDNRSFGWGNYDGTGDPIELPIRDYFQSFVYDVDFASAKKVGYNSVLGRGNTTNNAREIYPQSTIVEYHFSGFDPSFEGMDWRSLRLVFAEKHGDWYLVGVIHDQWTI